MVVMTIISSSMIAILASVFFIWLFRRLAIRLEFVDRPGGRKQHEQEVPLIGGIAIFFGFCFALLSLPLSLQSYRGLIAGGSLLLTIGIVDDFRELNSKLRLVGQIAAALLLICWGNLQVTSIGNLLFLGNISLGFWAIPFTVLLVAGYLNAMNMIDGQDGLAGGVALSQVALLGYLCWHSQRQTDFYILVILGLLLVVFLAFNMRSPWRRHAAIFLGDAGSTFIGFVIAWVAISVGQSNREVIRPVVILWILAFPVFDLFHVCIARFIQKKSLLLPSPDHIHHLLHILGVDVAISTWGLIVFSFALGVTGIVLNHFQVAEGWQFLGWLVALAGYLWVVKSVRSAAE
jgi:UDP-GlcNAc:undecaprenyl-phosphate/decaprenyl-phosphate GlcNAc-1-phosphate transferase